MRLHQVVDGEPPAPRPTARTSIPFVVLSCVGMAALVLSPQPSSSWHLVVAVAMFGVLLGVHWAAMRRSERSWLDVAAPLGSFALIVVLRDATGGGESALTPLVAVPILWLALYGSRRDLMAATVLAGLTFVLPVVVVGGDRYPVEEWGRALLWAGISFAVAPVVQRVVRQLRGETRHNRENSDRVETIMRGATMSSLITTDADGRVDTFSTGAEQELGYRSGDVIGKDLTALLEPEELSRVAAELGVAPGFSVLARLAHQRATSRIWTLVRSGGDRAFMRMAVTALRSSDDDITGYLCVAIDATDATRAQHALTQAEERWRALMDHLPDTTVLMVEEGTGVTVVTGAGVLAGRLRDGAGRRLTEIVDRDDAGTMARMLARAFEGQQGSTVHAQVGDLEHELVASPLPSTTARRQALVMVRDVSRERNRERRLTAAKERAERLFDDAPQGIALLDPDGTVVRANPALATLLGDGIVGTQLSKLSCGAHDPTIDRHLELVRRAPEQRTEAQWSVLGRDGEEVHVVLTSTMLVGEDGAGDQVLTNVVDVSERYRYERQLAFLAEHDSLTGLANRRRFDQQLERHVDDCRRYGPRGAVLMLDLDHFKEVNDALGHATGDQLLRDVARVLGQRMRSTDVVARLGGDEFAILLPYADRKSADLVAADVVERIHGEVRSLDDTRRHVTVSLGGVVVAADHASGSDLLSAADAAMYVAKKSGRNRYAFLPDTVR